MKKFKKEDYKIPVYSWCDDIETNAQEQIDNLARLPFAIKHVVILSDCHMGYGMPIGSVVATKNIISPNMVGVDIGCGVCAVKTNIQEMPQDDLKKIFSEIRKVIPLGFNHHKEAQNKNLMPCFFQKEEAMYNITNRSLICNQEYFPALKQIGTLGSGNHFIEFQKDQNGYIWIMIHSGSRNLGHKVATHYNKLAVELNEKWFSQVPKKWELAFLPLDSNESQAYMAEMNYCVEFAYANRKLMMDKILEIMENKYDSMRFNSNTMINIAHNYAIIENHYNQNLVIHRKGATRAYKDELGIIPGSQGTVSYIVKGKGNEESFKSCSHGAGRLMGRKQAEKTLDLIEEKKRLDDQEIVHSIRNKSDLDEASGAYKDIDIIMEQQKDLIDIVTKLQPIGVIKG